jgi:ABC-type nitrate/sulfonate/bicarbonate transport system substrate-binding protein
VRLSALLLVALALAGCGGGSSGAFGDATLSLGGRPGAEDAGVYLATARGYDTAEGVTLNVRAGGPGDFRLVKRPRGCVAVMAVVRPARLVLCVDPVTLDEERGKVEAVVRALQRGYVQAQLEPDEAVSAMAAQVPDLDARAVAARLDAVAPTWTAGARYFGQLAPGPDRDPSVAKPLG